VGVMDDGEECELTAATYGTWHRYQPLGILGRRLDYSVSLLGKQAVSRHKLEVMHSWFSGTRTHGASGAGREDDGMGLGRRPWVPAPMCWNVAPPSAAEPARLGYCLLRRATD